MKMANEKDILMSSEGEWKYGRNDSILVMLSGKVISSSSMYGSRSMLQCYIMENDNGNK